MSRKLLFKDVIHRFKSTHGDTYNYTLVNYIDIDTNVVIICNIHGQFKQTPYAHMSGRGCQKCGVIKCSKNSMKTTKSTLIDFYKIHGDYYDYRQVVYRGARIKVKILCKIHGIFEQAPTNHLSGNGCPKCKLDKLRLAFSFNNDKFIERAIKKHGYRFDYSFVEYKNAKTKVKIKCSIHGFFNQNPDDHLNDSGCPKCGSESIVKHSIENSVGWKYNSWEKQSKKSKNFDSFKVYVIKCYNEKEVFYKIGRTFTRTNQRFRNKKAMPYDYEIIKEFIFDTAKEAFDYENKLKREHKCFKYVPLISFNGKHECFTDYYFPCSS